MRDPLSILITGASGGIGAALALDYAAPGKVLFLQGRDAARLEALAGACRQKGAAVETALLDVRDRDGMAGWIAACDADAPLDLVVANAGISGGTGGGGEADDQARRIFDVNVTGVMNTVQPALAAMAPRGRGQVALMASMAAFRGFPGAPAYCATKACVRIWGEALRAQWRGRGIAVNVICPGFVRSGITDANRFRMPFFMEADRAARIIRRGLAANRGRIAFPWQTYLVARLVAALPGWLMDPLLARLPAKGQAPGADGKDA